MGTVVHTYGNVFWATWMELTWRTGQRLRIRMAGWILHPCGAHTRTPGPYRTVLSLVALNGWLQAESTMPVARAQMFAISAIFWPSEASRPGMMFCQLMPA